MFKKTIITLIALIIVFGLGIFAGTKLKSKSMIPAGQTNTYQAGWDAARQRLAEAGIGGIQTGAEIKNISGVVQKISGNDITVQVVPDRADPLADQNLDTRIVQVNGDTKFLQIVQKDQAQFQKEMQDFQKKMQARAAGKASDSQTVLTPPSMQQEPKEIALSDIKEGQRIMVSSNDNIRDKAQFVAVAVLVQSMPVVANPAQ